MTPALIVKAQRMYERMYDSRPFAGAEIAGAEIAASCSVTPMAIHRNIRSDSARTHPPDPAGSGRDSALCG